MTETDRQRWYSGQLDVQAREYKASKDSLVEYFGTVVDSLVWYSETLETDLTLCEIRGDARSDSLAVTLWGVEERLKWANEDRRGIPWVGIAIGIVVGVTIGATAAGLAFNLTGP